MANRRQSASNNAAQPTSAAGGSTPTNRDRLIGSGRRRVSAMNGITSTVDDKNNDYLCPICFDLIREAHITKCGHTYCHQCILKSIEKSKNCPKCNCALISADNIFPNIVLNELVTKYKHRIGINRTLGASGGAGTADADTLKNFLASETKKLTLPDVNVILEVLHQRKLLLEAESCAAQNRLLHEFLRHLLEQKQQQQQQIDKEITLIAKDIRDVEHILKEVHSRCPTAAEVENSTAGKDDAEVRAIKNEMLESIAMIESSVPSGASSSTSTVVEEGFNLNRNLGLGSSAMSTFLTRKQRMYAHFDDFIQCYFSARSTDLYFGKEPEPAADPENVEMLDTDTLPATTVASDEQANGLEVFRECLTKFSKYSSLRPLATLNYSTDLSYASTIVSSIEFNKDSEFFAIAGVTKRIKIFDYFSAIRDAVVDIKYPVNEMVCSSKISCVIWNCYFKDVLASSDYEGIVQIWDVARGVRTKVFQEHDKRCWSVDFNEIDTKLLASGSDDARVKLWSLNVEHSVHTLEAKANVCCVKFNPKSSCHLAFGSADHCVHYYDLRNMKEPLCVFKGHKKAVSYVKFLNTQEIVSAGTDGTLKLWNINSPPYCHRSFTGHTNEKNFVGLATNGDYLTCGSEDNSLCVYYKGLSKQLFNLKFDLKANQSRNSLIEIERSTDANDFVSAVCWRKQSDVVIAGNSRGIIKILELVYAGPVKNGQARVFWNVGAFPAVVVTGLGDASKWDDCDEINGTKENARIAAAAGTKALMALKFDKVFFEDLGSAQSAAEGAGLSAYKFQELKAADKKVTFPSLGLAEGAVGPEDFHRGLVLASAQNWARKLMDMPANHMTPTIFAKEATDKFKSLNVSCQVHEEAWAEKKKMGSFLSVTRGSVEPAKFLEITYLGGKVGDKPVCLVGKGITFDTGGISLKPGNKMDEMRADMGGAANVVATIAALAELKVQVNVKGFIPLCENMPGGNATKPGDVVYAMNGKSICVDNTDAEGRLVLADALCYASEFDPKFILDIATLTGAIAVALGDCAAGVFTNCNSIWTDIHAAGSETGDRVWRMPLFKHYSDQMTEHDGYDLNNLGKGKGGGSCTAAAFLREFVPKDLPWIHCDIAGVMGNCSDQSYTGSKGMSGRPMRTLVEFIERHAGLK